MAKAKAALLARYGSHPEDEPPEEAFTRNQKWAKPGPYVTKLSPTEEQEFQQWVKTNKVPWRDIPTSDYDMRGYWRALQEGKVKQNYSNYDHTMHFPDTWKTPYDAVFSRESMYATPHAPRWDGDRLVTNDGELIADETPKMEKNSEKSEMIPMYAPDGTARLVPASEAHALMMRGAKVGLLMTPPDGSGPRVVPFEYAEAALESGGTLLKNDGQPYRAGEAPLVVGHNAAGEPIWGNYMDLPASKRFEMALTNVLRGAAKGIFDANPTEQEKAEGLTSPYDFWMRPLERVVEGQANEAQEAENLLKHREYRMGVAHALASVIPMFGPMATQFGEDYYGRLAKGDIAGALGSLTGNAGTVAAMEGLPKAFRAGLDLAKTVPARVAEFQAPAESLNQAPRPGEMSPKERWEAANGMGVNLDRAQATGGATIPNVTKRITEHSLAGRGPFEENQAANLEALHQHAKDLREAAGPAMGREEFGEAAQKALQKHRGELVDEPGQRAEARDLLNRIDKRAMDGQEFGAEAQQALRTHHDAMYDKASNMLTGALERQGARVRTGNVEDIADQIYNENKDHFEKFPEALRTPGVKLAWDWVNRLKTREWKGDGAQKLTSPARSLPPKEVAQLRSELWNLYQTGDLVGTPAEGWLKQLTGALDESLTDPANEKGMTPGEIQKFRAGTSLWKRMKSMYDDPQSPFFSILRSPEPKTVAGTLEKLKPTAAQQFREAMGDIDRRDLVRQQQRQIVGHVLDPNENGAADLGGLASRFEKLPKEQMRELLDQQHLNALGSLAKRTKVETPYDQFPRLKQIVEAPDGMSASRAMFTDSGALRLTPEEVREMGNAEPNLIPALRRQTMDRLMDPAGNGEADLRNFPSRWNRSQSEPVAGVLTPDQVKALDDLAEVSRTVHADANPSGTAKVLQPVGELSGAVTAATTGLMTGHPVAAAVPVATMAAERLAAKRMVNPEATAAVMEHEKPPTVAETVKGGAETPGLVTSALNPVENPGKAAAGAAVAGGAAAQSTKDRFAQATRQRNAVPADANAREGVSTPPNGGQITDTGTAEPNEVHDPAKAAAEMQKLEQQDRARQASTAASAQPSAPGPGGNAPAMVRTGAVADDQGKQATPSPQAKLEAPEGATHEVLGANGETLGHIVDGEYVPLDSAAA